MAWPTWFLGTFDTDTAKFTKRSGNPLDRSKELRTIGFATDDKRRLR